MTERPGSVAPLPASARTADDDYSGVVACLGPEWRLAVTMKGDGYSLHQRIKTPDGPVWVPAGGRSPKTLVKIVAKYGDQVEGLAALCAHLPADPALAVPHHVAAVDAQAAVFVARDTTRADYARVVARDGTLRLVVCADAANYCLQWVKKSEQHKSDSRWLKQAQAQTLSDLRAWVCAKVGSIVGHGSDGVSRGDDVLPRWDAMVSGLPERADAGVWPDIPPHPGQ